MFWLWVRGFGVWGRACGFENWGCLEEGVRCVAPHECPLLLFPRRVKDSGCRVEGSGCRVEGFGFGVRGCRVYCSGL